MVFPLWASEHLNSTKADQCVKIKVGKGNHLPRVEQALADNPQEIREIGDITYQIPACHLRQRASSAKPMLI
ncbi:hypothetical protein [Pseudomonas sp. CC6-YY-74]|uniref:hypothetical protein n=1 Tax=Pseudomonas sp. CC6-YY-74 TaxID=1930532 RepID=UPI0012AC1306|nr:hypothetical protein [Pseudomonas sp. CC6-YY-74]